MGRVQAAAWLPTPGPGGLPQALAVPLCPSVGSTTTDDHEDQGVLAYLLLAFGLAWSTIFVARLLLGLSLETSLVLSGWLYSFAWAGFLAALVAVLKFLVPHATFALLWILAVSVLMIIGSVRPSALGPRRLGRSL
jgi:uncharacterized paraquat-inducible protein A